MLKVEALHAGYGPLEVLRGLSFEVPERSIVAVLGANGAGKTTVMRTLSGLIHARSGNITLDGHALGRLPAEKRVALGLALVPEGREIFGSLTVRENLLMGAFLRGAHTSEIEEDMERVLHYFPRLKARWTAHGASLSGGEGQMLAIGRALMSRPHVLLLDEPSHGLAPVVVELVFEVLARLNQEEGLSLLLAEQNASKALGIAQVAYVLQGGVIALQGTAATLANAATVRELYLGG